MVTPHTDAPPMNSLGKPLEFQQVRSFSEFLCQPLEVEDYVVQTMDDVSPAKWHLAHTTWFFETFILKPHLEGYRPFNDAYEHLFNSYYNSVGVQFSRPHRGLLSRPTVSEIYDYRRYVDERIQKILNREELVPLFQIGLNHEQQHQELILTDLKHVFGFNPLKPIYRESPNSPCGDRHEFEWLSFEGGIHEIGYEGSDFSFDNEGPRHKVHLEPFSFASHPVTCGEYLEFIGDGGYKTPTLWFSMGWQTVQEQGWNAPMYWENEGKGGLFTLSGLRKIDPEEPVCHLSYFEADAFARWVGARLPTEEEWEVASALAPVEGNFVEEEFYHPRPLHHVAPAGPSMMLGDVWEWTSSQYSPYPGYRAVEGALGEYNGKFMCNQFVLRGGSCATSVTHIRKTYRNFFPPDARWQFSGLRLAKDI
ncbi:MAG: ergothioneine biosynthesis protein EgtB [Candidatus Omnitrophica bacterium]|nr:ergothioneine biosynthesis protein EgtB [Candidatus Omnitrophota bacterium]